MIVQKLQLALIFVTEYTFSIEDKEKFMDCYVLSSVTDSLLVQMMIYWEMY
jgi:hypothetical protein